LKQEEVIALMNQARQDILKRHYGETFTGKETFCVFKFWDVLKMGVNLILTKPNTV